MCVFIYHEGADVVKGISISCEEVIDGSSLLLQWEEFRDADPSCACFSLALFDPFVVEAFLAILEFAIVDARLDIWRFESVLFLLTPKHLLMHV